LSAAAGSDVGSPTAAAAGTPAIIGGIAGAPAAGSSGVVNIAATVAGLIYTISFPTTVPFITAGPIPGMIVDVTSRTVSMVISVVPCTG